MLDVGCFPNPIAMEISRRTSLIYALLFAVWVLVVGWQAEEHIRVKETAKTDLRNRSREIANTLSATIRALRFRGTILEERLQLVLGELVNERTNELVRSGELLSVVLLNATGEPVAAAGSPIDFTQKDILQEGERWGNNAVTFVNPVEGASLRPEGSSNATVVLPSMHDLTNNLPDGGRSFQRRDSRSDNPPEPRRDEPPPPPPSDGPPPDGGREPRTNSDRGDRQRESRARRPPWLRWMDDAAFQALAQKRELHGLVLAMSTDSFRSVCLRDLWVRCVVAFFAGISAVGVGLAWRNLARSSDLQIRLIRASEMNTHLREMNLAAAGLAHETRNPLNIIRGMAQMISKQPDAPGEIRDKSRAIVDETDKVTAQLNEFINYSRPREIRRSVLALTPAINEVVRALNYDVDEKKLKLEVKGEPLSVEADEQLFRQALFNLLLNAVQAADSGGEIQIVAARSNASEAVLEVRDNGPGVPPDRRKEIFKPYFTTHQKGTGLGLAVVQQIVLAHGWEIECVGNEPKGAVFRVTHLKIAE